MGWIKCVDLNWIELNSRWLTLVALAILSLDHTSKICKTSCPDNLEAWLQIADVLHWLPSQYWRLLPWQFRSLVTHSRCLTLLALAVLPLVALTILKLGYTQQMFDTGCPRNIAACCPDNFGAWLHTADVWHCLPSQYCGLMPWRYWSLVTRNIAACCPGSFEAWLHAADVSHLPLWLDYIADV